MRAFLLSLFSVALLGACATANPVDVQGELNRWVGQDADTLVKTWGPPDRSYDFKDGSRVLEYERNRYDTYGGYDRYRGGIGVGSDGAAIGMGFPLWHDEPRVSIRRCMMKFETNRKRVIRAASFAGPNCGYALKNSIAKR